MTDRDAGGWGVVATDRAFDLLTGDATCPVCGQGEALVSPECGEGHGSDCPDRLCLACGIAMFVDPPIVGAAGAAVRAPAAPRSA